MMYQDWLAIAVAAIAAVSSPMLVKPLLRRGGVFDIPNQRSSHTASTLRGGGIASAIGISAGYLIAIPLTSPPSSNVLLIVSIGSMAFAAIGLVEDLRGIRVFFRLSLQLIAALLVSLALVSATSASLWWIPLATVFIAGYVNVANFIDGINSISGLHGLTVCALFAVLGLMTGTVWLQVVGLLIAVVFAAFLPWNLSRQGFFLGDVGSYLLGGSIGVVAVAAIFSGLPLFAVMAPLVIYLADTSSTVFRRLLRGEKWHEAHRSHVYQKLSDLGLSHVQVALIVSGAALVTGLLGLASVNAGGLGAVVYIFLILATGLIYLMLPTIISRRIELLTIDGLTPRLPLTSTKPMRAAPKEQKWAVLGASGFIGSAIMESLLRDGANVVAVSAPRVFLDLGQRVDIERILDERCLNEVEALSSAFEGIDIVVNAAGLALPDSGSTPALFGANSLLPALVSRACNLAGVEKFIHLSSAAVQGRRKMLDESPEVAPFSAYSRSKALGERLLLAGANTESGSRVIIVRATSVQGTSRGTSGNLRKVASSRISSVAQPGNQMTVVSSLTGIVNFVLHIGMTYTHVPAIVIQPSEGLTTSAVLELAGGRTPRMLPSIFCRAAVVAAYGVSAVFPALRGVSRRVELMWFGQKQEAGWGAAVGFKPEPDWINLAIRGPEETESES